MFGQLFKDGDPVYEAVRWKDLSIEADSFESVLWMGSEGASTPLHYDTYGCNVVLQVQAPTLSCHYYIFDSEKQNKYKVCAYSCHLRVLGTSNRRHMSGTT